MKFSARISRQPIPVDDDRARHIREIFDPGGALSDLVAGAAGSSPHLADLIEKEAGWLAGALDDDDVVARETAGFEDLDSAALSVALRRAKRRVALFVALADLGGVWSLEQVTVDHSVVQELVDTGLITAAAAAEHPERRVITR